MNDTINICRTCLCSERQLYSLKKMESFLRDLKISELNDASGSVCWECRSLILKFFKFKVKICRAQEALCDIQKIKNRKCLSTLDISTEKTYNYEFQYNYDPLVQTIDETKTIKQEEDENFDTLIVFDDSEMKDHIKYNPYSDDDSIDNIEDCDIDNNVTKDNQNECREVLTSENNKVESSTQANRKEHRKEKHLRKNLSESRTREEIKNEGLDDKFVKIVFTEEEMNRIRDEKRNQPNYKKIPFKCDMCVLGFTRRETFDLHMEKKHDEKMGTFSCDVCSIRFTSRRWATRHRERHYVSYRCRLCKFETSELWSAVGHCREKHPTDTARAIHCTQCDAIAQTPEGLAEHVQTQHTLYCKTCGEKFKGKDTLRTHMRRIHGVKRDFACDICRKTFKTKSRLESHVVSHNPTIAKKLAYCTICNVQYKNIYVYRNHLKNSVNHVREGYQCSECDKKFASKVYWKKHYNFYHLKRSEFKCDVCNKLFISDWRLKNHQQKHHGLSRPRNHTCNVCGKKFYNRSTLKGHQLTHSEQRSYMCSQCGDTFKQPAALYTHSKLVHKGGNGTRRGREGKTSPRRGK